MINSLKSIIPKTNFSNVIISSFSLILSKIEVEKSIIFLINNTAFTLAYKTLRISVKR